IYDWVFPPRHKIQNLDELADFIDQQAAFLVQKGIYEYSRARAGHYSKVLFREKEFQEAVEQSRWQAYPLGLAMVAEVVEGALHCSENSNPGATGDSLANLTLHIFDSYARPAELSDERWRTVRSDLAANLNKMGSQPTKRVIDIPGPYLD